jgi:hypothetical protein
LSLARKPRTRASFAPAEPSAQSVAPEATIAFETRRAFPELPPGVAMLRADELRRL